MALKKIYYLFFTLCVFHSGCQKWKKKSNQVQSIELAQLENLDRKKNFKNKVEEKFVSLLKDKTLIEHAALSAQISYIAVTTYDLFKNNKITYKKGQDHNVTIYNLQMLAWSNEIIFDIAIKKLNEKEHLNHDDKNDLNTESDALVSEYFTTQTRSELKEVLNINVTLNNVELETQTDNFIKYVSNLSEKNKQYEDTQKQALLEEIFSDSIEKIQNSLNDLIQYQNNHKDKIKYTSLQGENKELSTASLIEALNLAKDSLKEQTTTHHIRFKVRIRFEFT